MYLCDPDRSTRLFLKRSSGRKRPVVLLNDEERVDETPVRICDLLVLDVGAVVRCQSAIPERDALGASRRDLSTICTGAVLGEGVGARRSAVPSGDMDRDVRISKIFLVRIPAETRRSRRVRPETFVVVPMSRDEKIDTELCEKRNDIRYRRRSALRDVRLGSLRPTVRNPRGVHSLARAGIRVAVYFRLLGGVKFTRDLYVRVRMSARNEQRKRGI